MRCRFYRWKLSRRLAAGEAPTGALLRHLERCRPCRQYRRRLAALDERLRADVPEAGPLEAELRARIVTAARRMTPAAPAPHRPALRIAAVGLGVAACLAAAFVLYHALVPDRPADGDQPVGPAVAAPPSLPTPADVDELTMQLLAGAGRLAEAPMTDEIRRLAADTRQLGGFLLARLPLGLAGTDGRELINDLLPPSPAVRPATSAPARPRIN